MPTGTWFKDGKQLSSGGSIQLTQSPESCCIHVVGASRTDSGEYELMLSNASGTERIPITFLVEGQFCLSVIIIQHFYGTTFNTQRYQTMVLQIHLQKNRSNQDPLAGNS